MRNIRIIYNRSEIGAGTRGSSLGIDALKIVAINNDNDFFTRTPSLTIEDENDILTGKIKHPRAKRIEGILPVYEQVCDSVCDTLKEGAFPLILSGDHASAGGSVAGVKKAFPDKRVGIVWIDAHADIHSPYTSPSGNVHGMPIATMLNEDNTDFLDAKPVDAETKALWDKLKNVGGISPKIISEDIVYISVRDTEKEEDFLIEKYNIINYTPELIREKSLEKVISEIKNERLKNCDVIYVTFDVDSLDCDEVSRGTGTPVENGLHVEEAKYILKSLLEWDKVVSLEVTEINPLLDEKKNKMAEAAFEILAYSMGI